MAGPKAKGKKRTLSDGKRPAALKSEERRAPLRKSETMKQLEAIVFGGDFGVGQDGADDDNDQDEDGEQEEEVEEPESDILDMGGGPSRASSSRPPKKRKKKKGAAAEADADSKVGRPAWIDEDDATMTVDLTARNRTQKLRRDYVETEVDGVEYERRLREQFRKLHGNTNWSEPNKDAAWDDQSDGEAEADEVVPTSAKHNLANKGQRGERLRPQELDVEILREAELVAGERGQKGACAIQALQFHPNSELMMCGGMDKTLRFFAIDGDENPRVSSHFIKNFPIMGARFMPSGDQVVMTCMDHRVCGFDVQTGQTSQIKAFDSQGFRRLVGPFVGPSPGDGPAAQKTSQLYAMLGDAGTMLLSDVRTKMPVRTLRMNSLGAAAVFSCDKEVLYSVDQEAHIYEWDLRTGRCRQRVRDEYASRVSALSLSRITANAPTPTLAVGTLSGNIDFFDVSGPKMSKKPTKSIDNLTTRISGLHFHHQGELMVGFSQFKKDALKVVHMATGTVFANWPPPKCPLNAVSAVDLSREGGFMAIGNERGRVLLYRLSQYEKSK